MRARTTARRPTNPTAYCNESSHHPTGAPRMNPSLLRRCVALAVLLFLGTAAAHAQGQRPQPAPQSQPQGGAPAEAQRPPEANSPPPAGPPLPTVSLESLVERVERNS